MAETFPPTTPSPKAPDYADRVRQSMLGAFDIAAAYLGVRLGLYASLAADGPATAAELAARCDCNERLIREWLEQQAATSVLTAAREGDVWRFTLPEEDARVLVDPQSPDSMAGTIRQQIADVAMLPRLVETYRTGVGIPYAEYGADEAEGQAQSTSMVYRDDLPGWFAAVPDLHERLQRGGRVLDIGCGGGWSSVNIARAYPQSTVDGIDLDPASIAAARAAAEEAGVTDRVSFQVQDAAELSGADYDAATIFEMLHDLARPVETLTAARQALAPGGVVLISDELTAEEFDPPTSELEQRFYGWSLLSCLPMSMTEPGSAATGTVMRPPTLRAYATAAGFSSAEILPVRHEQFQLYLLRQ